MFSWKKCNRKDKTMGIFRAALDFVNNSNYKAETKEYSRGYDAADEFTKMLDHEPSDEEWNTHEKAVKMHHSDEYIIGYAECLEDYNAPTFWEWIRGIK